MVTFWVHTCTFSPFSACNPSLSFSLQVLNGDVEEAICSHALYYSIWLKYGVLPERYNWHLKSPDVLFYPLRPEFVESTYLLYRATKNPFYLHVGKDIVDSLNRYTKVKYVFFNLQNVEYYHITDSSIWCEFYLKKPSQI